MGSPLVRYLEPFLMKKSEFQQMGKIIRRLMTMHKALHSRDDIDSMCQEKLEQEDTPAFKRA